MKTIEFKEWRKGLPELSREQRSELERELHARKPGNEVVGWLERGGMLEACVHCGGDRLYRWGKEADLQRFRCRECGKTFTVLTGTPLARLRHKGRWLDYAQALEDGLTVRKAAARCGVDKNTSFRWRHRFLIRPALEKARHLEGIAEADETFFRESFKGQRKLPRVAHRRGYPASKRGTGKEQIPVLVMRDRHGATADFRLKGTAAEDIEPALRGILSPDSILCTDGAAAYKIATKHLGIAHRAINLSAGVRVLAGVYHIQNVNAYDSRLKGWMRRFHGVATKYLENYLGWRRWLERWGQGNSPRIALWAAMGWENRFQQLMQT